MTFEYSLCTFDVPDNTNSGEAYQHTDSLVVFSFRLIVMWSVPFNFNLRDSYYAVGMVYQKVGMVYQKVGMV